MKISTALTEDEIWRRVYLIGGDDYTISGDVIYVLKNGTCIAEITLMIMINDDKTTPKL